MNDEYLTMTMLVLVLKDCTTWAQKVCVCIRAQNSYRNSSKSSAFFSHTREQGLQLHSAHLLLSGLRCVFPS